MSLQDPTAPETPLKGKKRSRESSTFFRWFTQEKAFEPGLVDTLADIIKDQIYLNPLAFLDAAQNEVCFNFDIIASPYRLSTCSNWEYLEVPCCLR